MVGNAVAAGELITLTAWLANRGPLTLADLVHVGGELAANLTRMHAVGQLHLDLCPSKVLVSDRRDKVEYARVGPPAELDMAGKVASPADGFGYVAPEILRGNPPDAHSDLFSLGCVLYAMAAGCGPFEAGPAESIGLRVCQATPKPLGEINRELSAWLIATIECLLEKEPERRFTSAAEVAEMLVQQRNHPPVVYRPSPRSGHRSLVAVPIGDTPKLAPPVVAPPVVSALPVAVPISAAISSARSRPRNLKRLAVVALLLLCAAGIWRWIDRAQPDVAAKAHPSDPMQSFVELGSKASEPAAPVLPAAGPVGITKTEVFGDSHGEQFDDLSSNLEPLVGFELSEYGFAGGHRVIKSIRPIYSSQDGDVHGKPHELLVRIEARPGYAVGGVIVRHGQRVDGIKLIFMRIAGDTLDRQDSYESAWFGGHGGDREATLGGNGNLIVGICGRATHDLHALGLIEYRPSEPRQDSSRRPRPANVGAIGRVDISSENNPTSSRAGRS
jgi:hypothetical protein